MKVNVSGDLDLCGVATGRFNFKGVNFHVLLCRYDLKFRVEQEVVNLQRLVNRVMTTFTMTMKHPPWQRSNSRP